MSEDLTALVDDWTNVPDAAERLGVPLSTIRQMVKDGLLISVRRDGVVNIPAALVANADVLRFLPGVITLLRDGRFTDEEILRWLFAPDDSLASGTLVGELVAGRGTEVKRRAQASGI